MTAAGGGNGNQVVVGSGKAVTLSDPKDPWPPPLAFGGTPTETAFLTTSAILPSMNGLVTAFGGKGGDSAAPAPAIHALLIGIDAYAEGVGQAGTNYRPLRGCVSDILDAEAFLRTTGVPAERITRLIAPAAGGPGSDLATAPAELPTYANIVAAWQPVTAAARP